MRLLLFTQKIDVSDSVLGFMHAWIEAIADQVDSVIAVCLEEGEHDLPGNVKVLSLGKESMRATNPNATNRFTKRLKYIFRFYRLIWQERENYTHVLVHMNPEYVVMGGLFWRFWGKKIGLWYAHGHVPFYLRLAEKFAHIIFTSTKSGFRLKSKKLNVIGQGIDTDYFKPAEEKFNHEKFRIVSVGRISPVKDYETLISAISNLPSRSKVHVDIIGGAGTPEQEHYFNNLKDLVREKNLEEVVDFAGPVANRDILGILQSSDLFLNMSRTGSLDKAMLEAMACEVPVLTCNEAMLEVLGNYKDELMYGKVDNQTLARKIEEFVNMDNSSRISLGGELRNIVVENHSLKNFIRKILERFEKKYDRLN